MGMSTGAAEAAPPGVPQRPPRVREDLSSLLANLSRRVSERIALNA
jgi:hypothetical protein